MTEDEMKEFLRDNAEAIKSAVRDKLISNIMQEYRWEIGGEVAKAVNEFVKDEIVPEVKEFLAGEKGVILMAAQEGCRQIGEVMTKNMVEAVTKEPNRLCPEWRDRENAERLLTPPCMALRRKRWTTMSPTKWPSDTTLHGPIGSGLDAIRPDSSAGGPPVGATSQQGAKSLARYSPP